MSFARVALLACVFGLVACDPQPEADSLETDALSERFACDDVTMVVAAADGREALLIGVEDQLAASAMSSDAPAVGEYELPDERVTIRWVSGTNVFQGQCGRDTGETWQLDERLDALTGRLTVIVEPDAEGRLRLVAAIEDLELVGESHEVHIDAAALELPLDH